MQNLARLGFSKPDSLYVIPHTLGWRPFWCHYFCYETVLELYDKETEIILISAAASLLVVSREADEWLLEWEINQPPKIAHGKIVLTKDELQRAFGLSFHPGESGDELKKLFGGQSAEPGKYIRWENFLNVPCPGSGDHFDPNFSMMLDDEIRKAIHKITKAKGRFKKTPRKRLKSFLKK
ncbi:hypothetical protein A3B18_02845 [Candidatus Giovannonibacteria bacterium RIFCSPLOWO2_01_FULL_46_13]|uniref:Uncharacterized protein n=1 Tax=Candidatus Giovannonibacteria bacterium RIFCSPLOWO2_01_FULL_46_13 TaxID=1798352 RepID=A0A1F5X2Z6_9BACT|nr:MAG: hypothetical protein A3B18_02845 [Candidatus Giovannonibacteria bacterium RIFCSPLOWO2_01_FULL_46_13]